jgi:2-polyprenyl-3-methyl-5-hydroxy-6-metoxy-1,4-benzoquinol methylase
MVHLPLREISEREFVHERLGEDFDRALSNYDTQRRLSVLVNDFLPDEVLLHKRVLDVGTGLGFFAEQLQRRGATVTAVDIGENMLRRVNARVGCECLCVDALGLLNFFGSDTFDVVLSSECIEHTPHPEVALQQMCAVLKPGGYISLSTPNLLWYPLVRMATVMKLRPFDGLENFSTFGSIRRTLKGEGVEVLKEKGLHILPFQFGLHRMSTWCDSHLQILRMLMINLCILGVKGNAISGS